MRKDRILKYLFCLPALFLLVGLPSFGATAIFFMKYAEPDKLENLSLVLALFGILYIWSSLFLLAYLLYKKQFKDVAAGFGLLFIVLMLDQAISFEKVGFAIGTFLFVGAHEDDRERLATGWLKKIEVASSSYSIYNYENTAERQLQSCFEYKQRLNVDIERLNKQCKKTGICLVTKHESCRAQGAKIQCRPRKESIPPKPILAHIFYYSHEPEKNKLFSDPSFECRSL